VRPRHLSLFALVSAAVVALTGCAAETNRPAAGLSIVATTTQVAEFTRAVVGETPDVALAQLIQPNQSAHSFDPSAGDLTALAQADVLVVNGVGLETWLDDAIDASGFSGVTIDASRGITLLDGDNPHVWTDPRNADAMVKTIAAGLAGADAGHATAFDANATAYGTALARLDEWTRDNIDAVPVADRLLVSNHDALGYFTAAYDVTYVGSVIPSFDDNAEPSAAEIDKLVAAITETGVRAVFSEASLNPKAAQAIADEAGVRVYSGPDALYVDSLGPAGSDGDTYIGAQVHNVTRVFESWGIAPSDVPAGLE